MYVFIYLAITIVLNRTQDEKKIDDKEEKIVGSYLLLKYVNSDLFLLDST